MYLPSDLTLSRAIQNDLLGTVKVPTSALVVSGSRPVSRAPRTICPACLQTIQVA
ncbi:MAG TPA: hypothetical protein VJ938_01975 [Acidimicrobiia bacterium]|nr:hypothetical protein [Acidimicrobiia bacterium]